nr:hypothetical protein [Streptomyces sp. SID5785]
MVTATGNPPKVYKVPVPDLEGDGPATVLVYRREPVPDGRAVRLVQKWRYVFVPDGKTGTVLKWPWSKGSSKESPETGGK